MLEVNMLYIFIYMMLICLDCYVFKCWLVQQGFVYEECDLIDFKIVEEVKVCMGVRVVFIIIVGLEVFYGIFLSQKLGFVKVLGLIGSV